MWARTSSKYLLALSNGNFLMANAVSLVFYTDINRHNNKLSTIKMSRYMRMIKRIHSIDFNIISQVTIATRHTI